MSIKFKVAGVFKMKEVDPVIGNPISKLVKQNLKQSQLRKSYNVSVFSIQSFLFSVQVKQLQDAKKKEEEKKTKKAKEVIEEKKVEEKKKPEIKKGKTPIKTQDVQIKITRDDEQLKKPTVKVTKSKDMVPDQKVPIAKDSLQGQVRKSSAWGTTISIQKKGTSYETLIKNLQESHPRKKDGKEYSFGEACMMDTGFHTPCCNSSYQSGVQELGVATTLYFKFLKYLVCYFLVFSIISFPMVFLNIQSYMKNMADNKTILSYNNFQEFVTSLKQNVVGSTVGAIGLNSFRCKNGKFDVPYKFSCNSGLISSQRFIMGLARTSTVQQCGYYTENSVDQSCVNENSASLLAAQNKCMGKQNCTFKLQKSFFSSILQCQGFQSEAARKGVMVRFYCDQQTVEFQHFTITKRDLSKLYVWIDTVISAIFFWMIFSLSYSTKVAVDNIYDLNLAAQLFALEITRLPKNVPKHVLIGEIWSFFEDYIKKYCPEAKGDKQRKIYDVAVAESSQTLRYKFRIVEFSKQKQEIINRIFAKTKDKQLKKFLEKKKKIKLNDLNRFSKTLKEKEHKWIKKSLLKWEKIHIKQEELEKKLLIKEEVKGKGILSVFITFNKIKYRDFIQKDFTYFPVQLFFLKLCFCCFKKNKRWFRGTQRLVITDAPEPSGIKWENLEKSSFSLIFRKLISTIMTILILFVCFFLFVYTDIKREEVVNSYPYINCKLYEQPTQLEALADYQLQEEKENLMECYCSPELVLKVQGEPNVFDKPFLVDGQEKNLCQEWYLDKILINSFTIFSVVLVIIINKVLQVSIYKLSKFEGHKSYTGEKASLLIKIFLSSLMNLGFIILIVNYRFTFQDNQFLQGKYEDLNILWYRVVGSTIIITLIINTLQKPIVQIIMFFVKYLLRCCDRKCSSDMHNTRKVYQKDYEQVYTGPEFRIDLRYAAILTQIYLCMIYGSGLPILYIVTFIFLIIQYFIDKYYMLRVFQRHPSVDDNMDKSAQRALYYLIYIHILFSIFIFGNSDIFEKENNEVPLDASMESIATVNTKNGNNLMYLLQMLLDRILTVQNQPLVFAFLLFLAVELFSMFVLVPFKELLKCMCGYTFKKTSSGDNSNISFFHLLSLEQIKAELVEDCNTITKMKDKKGKLFQKISRKIIVLQELENNILEGKVADEATQIKLLGLHSYNIQHNKLYKGFVTVEMTEKQKLRLSKIKFKSKPAPKNKKLVAKVSEEKIKPEQKFTPGKQGN